MIDLNLEKDVYFLKFKYDFYIKGRIFYLNGTNYLPLEDECQVNETKKEIICQLHRNMIEENLIKEGNFYLWTFDNYYEQKKMNSVLDIIIKYNNPKEKEIITVKVGTLEETNTKAMENTAYKTSSTFIPNITTGEFNMTFIGDNNTIREYPCYLKISINKKYLNLLCHITDQGLFFLKQQSYELNDIHYKYNFIVKKEEQDNIPVNVEGEGTRVLFTYPYISNLTLLPKINLIYIMDYPYYSGNIAITQDHFYNESEEVTCEYRGNVKICEVPINFFYGKETGFFYTYHYSNSYYQSGGYVPYYESTPFYFILPPNNVVAMNIQKDSYYFYIGKNGILDFITNYKDTKNIFIEKDIENKFSFKANITSEYEGDIYGVTCRIWNPKNEYLRLFCQLGENTMLRYSWLNNINFTYQGNNIFIFSEEYFDIRQEYDYEYPFLYSEAQTIYLDDEQETCELRFKTLIYNNELIFLKGASSSYFNYFVLDNCVKQGKELICDIDKNKLQANINTLGEFHLYYYIDKKIYRQFESVFSITIAYKKPIFKENIYVQIDSLISNSSSSGYNGSIAFRTNVGSIPDILTKTTSQIRFNTTYPECYLKKSYPNNLLLLCHTSYREILQLNIESSISLTNIHYKYNFIINSYKSESFSNYYSLCLVEYTYPTFIDLTSGNSVRLKYFGYYTYRIRDIRLEPFGNDLNCYRVDNLVDCEISASHFNYSKSDYFSTYHQDDYGQWQILYDASPIYVLLPKDNTIVMRIKKEYNQKVIKVGNKGTLYFVTDYNDRANNIFDYNSDRKTSIKTTLLDSQKNNYEVTCRIWKQDNGLINIFCDLNENLRFEEQRMSLDMTRFYYNNYNFIIYSVDYLAVNQLDYNISFIYSNEQNIKFYHDEPDNDYYNLSFRLGSYKSEKLYLKGDNYNEMLCDDIINDGLELSCHIYVSKLKQLLTVSYESFKLVGLNEYYGLYEFNYVSDIIINCFVDNKETITINYLRLINNISEIGSTFAYLSDITNCSSFMTKEFWILWNLCRFKKTDNNPLIMLCTPRSEGDFIFGNYSNPIYSGNIHYKYNIVIGPLENYEIVYIKDYGTQIKLVNPESLDFFYNEQIEVDFHMDNPELMNNLKLNPDSKEELQCKNLNGLKRCIVSLEHFNGKKQIIIICTIPIT